MPSSQEITRKAKSNLAFALSCLPKERKQDMVSFYAFCRVIDDLADDPTSPLPERKSALAAWRTGIENGFENPDSLQQEIASLIADSLQQEIASLISRYHISKQPFLDLIDGCTSDLEPQRFQTWDDLMGYTFRVASCVGLVSIRIFGCTHPRAGLDPHFRMHPPGL